MSFCKNHIFEVDLLQILNDNTTYAMYEEDAFYLIFPSYGYLEDILKYDHMRLLNFNQSQASKNYEIIILYYSIKYKIKSL